MWFFKNVITAEIIMPADAKTNNKTLDLGANTYFPLFWAMWETIIGDFVVI